MKTQFSVAATTFLLASIGAALPTLPLTYPQLRVRNDSNCEALAERIKYIAPGSKECDGSAECRTYQQVAPHMAASLKKYGVTNAGAIAAVLALTSLESVDYRYKHNVSPGRPGQGTSNMQMFEFNLEYARSIPELAGELAELGTLSKDTASDQQMNAVLALVQPDEYNFGSGPWFLTTKCPEALKAFDNDIEAGWAAYMECVGVEPGNEERQAYWTRAKVGMQN